MLQRICGVGGLCPIRQQMPRRPGKSRRAVSPTATRGCLSPLSPAPRFVGPRDVVREHGRGLAPLLTGLPSPSCGPSQRRQVQMTQTELRIIDDLRRWQPDLPARAEAIRRLIQLGLTAKTESPKKDGVPPARVNAGAAAGRWPEPPWRDPPGALHMARNRRLVWPHGRRSVAWASGDDSAVGYVPRGVQPGPPAATRSRITR
jgi:hypothetical protein